MKRSNYHRIYKSVEELINKLAFVTLLIEFVDEPARNFTLSLKSQKTRI